MTLLQALIVAGFASLHLLADRLRFLHVIPRSRWLSAAGGISVAYVFVHVFPELAEAQRRMEAGWPAVVAAERHAYLVALAGLATFYGLERLVKHSQRRRNDRPGPDDGPSTTSPGVFRLHVTSFALYNALVGYLLVHRPEQSLRELLLFAGAMGVHFLVNDYGLRQDHKAAYRQRVRWMLVAAIAGGWLTGLLVEISEAAVATLFAFLAGGVVMNVLKEELPEERQSRFLPFLLGATGYAILLLLI